MNWPSSDFKSISNYYGKIGQNQTSLILPYPMVLAWDRSAVIKKISCHEKVAESLSRIFSKTLSHYGIEEIKKLHLHHFGGCLNVRKKRGGNSWSLHSWGIAVDLDPDRNQLKWGKDKAEFAKPAYLPFWAIVEGEGWVSLGRSCNFDWMHFQATRNP